MILEEIGHLPGYELIDSGEGYRLERFGDFVLSRPDPAVLWARSQPESIWQKADAIFTKHGEQADEKGAWKKNSKVPEKWLMDYELPGSLIGGLPGSAQTGKNKISFYVQLTPFKHTGVFPEQVANWNFIVEQIGAVKAGGHGSMVKQPERIKFLNLFGYTGIASVLAAKLGAEVTHVDASRPSLNWANENMLASGLPKDAIRWILDDVLKFVKREVKRGKTYDAIILDPPAYGRGAKGEVWKFNEDLPKLLEEIKKIISPDFKFLIINAYAVSVSSLLLKNLLADFGLPVKKIDYGELVLKEKSGRELSTGIFARLY